MPKLATVTEWSSKIYTQQLIEISAKDGELAKHMAWVQAKFVGADYRGGHPILSCFE